jgi:hypothetical protein
MLLWAASRHQHDGSNGTTGSRHMLRAATSDQHTSATGGGVHDSQFSHLLVIGLVIEAAFTRHVCEVGEKTVQSVAGRGAAACWLQLNW